MNEFQKRLWDWMIQMVWDYNQRILSFHQLANNLEKSFGAGKFQDNGILQGWHGVWNPLAEIDASYAYEEGPDPMMVQPAVEKMRAFLLERKELHGKRETNKSGTGPSGLEEKLRR